MEPLLDSLSRAITEGDRAATRACASRLGPAGMRARANGPTAPVALAVERGQFDLLPLLLEFGADPNAPLTGTSVSSALHRAASERAPEAIESLLRHGARVDARDRDGDTPLMLAAGEGCEASVRLLLDAGADPNAANAKDWSALHWAAEGGNTAVVSLLLRHGGEPTVGGYPPRTPAEQARRVGCDAAAEVLAAHARARALGRPADAAPGSASGPSL